MRPHAFFCGDVCRFWAKVQKGPGCWLWTGNRSGGAKGKTYGQFTLNRDGKRITIGAHVYAYELTHGKIPEGLSACHTCDVPLCVRNDADCHIYPGDHTRNMRDARDRGRLRTAHPRAQKLTPDQVYAFRVRVAAGETQIAVASDFGITKGFASLLMQGKRRQYDAPILPASELKRVG